MFTWKQWFIGVAGTVFLGALGSALWQLILSPLLTRSRNLALTIVTFGIATLRNRIYRGISLGSMYALHQLLFGSVICILSVIALFNPRLIELSRDIPLLRLVATLIMFFVLVSFAGLFTQSYVISVIAYFENAMTMLAAHIDEQRIRMYRSRFAAARTAKDFNDLFMDIQDATDALPFKINRFDLW